MSMDEKNRPHSRKKTTGSGSAGAGRGRRVETGSGGVGSGGRGGKGSGKGIGSDLLGSLLGGSGSSSGHSSSGGSLLGGLLGGSGNSSSSSGGSSVGGDLLGSLLGGSGSSGNGSHSSGSSSGGKKSGLSLKKLLLIIGVVLLIIFLLKTCSGGMGGDMSDFSSDSYNDYTGFSDSSINFGTTSDDADTSYSKPDMTVSSLAREKRYVPGKNDTVTVMVYLCGTDLESGYGMATSDLQEMMKAELSDKINLIVETGGCKKWKNNVVSSSKNQIYKVETGGLRPLEKDYGTAAMTDPNNLTKFIDYCETNFPAERNILIFWDHGGGSLSGYGYDEKNPSSSSMTLSKINTALKNANCTFDFIGFDACLMATLETALVCDGYADYLLASEETEPGTGWYYTNWLTKLSKNPSVSTVELSKTIIDDFVAASCSASPSSKVTLSLTDLAELEGTVPEPFRDFSVSTTALLKSDDYKQVSDARAGVRQFSQKSKINQVDLADLAERIGTDEAKALSEALQSCVKYNRTTISRCYGLSIYFPYETTKSVKSAISSYNDLGIDSEYSKCIQSFASLEYGGQIAASASQTESTGGDFLGTLISGFGGSGNGSSTSPLDILLGGGSSSSSGGFGLDAGSLISLLGGFSGRSMPAEYDWVDTELIADHAEEIAEAYLDPTHIVPTQSEGKTVLHLTEDEWALIQTVELNVFVRDGDGYIDLGYDNTFDWYGDDLLLEYDGTWLTLNGNLCAYYLVSDTQQEDGTWTTIGRIPALLNGQAVNLQVIFNDKYPQGIVTGAYPLYEDNRTEAQAKGDIPVRPGDTVELLCDYYSLDGDYDASYTLGTKFTVPASGLTLQNLTVDAESVSVTYRLTDIYGNHFWVAAE